MNTRTLLEHPDAQHPDTETLAAIGMSSVWRKQVLPWLRALSIQSALAQRNADPSDAEVMAAAQAEGKLLDRLAREPEIAVQRLKDRGDE